MISLRHEGEFIVSHENENFTFKLSDEFEGYFMSFINEISFGGKISTFYLKLLAEQSALGTEYYLCTFNKDDFGYKENMVTLIFWRPAAEEDTILYFNKELFYNYLLRSCQRSIKKNPEDRTEVLSLLETIRSNLFN